MTEPAPWRCPECRAWIAPHVDQHRCDPPSGGVAVRPVVAPYAPSGGTYTWPVTSTVTVVPAGGYSYGTGGGGGGAESPSAHWLCTSAWPEVSWGDRAA